MRHPIKYMLGTLLGLILALSVVPGHAQDGAKVKATIPFNFVVGNKKLKAGDYVIESLLANNALQFRSEDGDVQQIAFTVPIETNRTGNHERLLFHNDGDQYFLSQVWLSGDKTDANSFPEFRKRRLRTAQTATRWLLARKPIHAELAGNGRMDRIDGAADPTASSSCLTSSKQSIGSAK